MMFTENFFGFSLILFLFIVDNQKHAQSLLQSPSGLYAVCCSLAQPATGSEFVLCCGTCVHCAEVTDSLDHRRIHYGNDLRPECKADISLTTSRVLYWDKTLCETCKKVVKITQSTEIVTQKMRPRMAKTLSYWKEGKGSVLASAQPVVLVEIVNTLAAVSKISLN